MFTGRLKCMTDSNAHPNFRVNYTGKGAHEIRVNTRMGWCIYIYDIIWNIWNHSETFEMIQLQQIIHCDYCIKSHFNFDWLQPHKQIQYVTVNLRNLISHAFPLSCQNLYKYLLNDHPTNWQPHTVSLRWKTNFE